MKWSSCERFSGVAPPPRGTEETETALARSDGGEMAWLVVEPDAIGIGRPVLSATDVDDSGSENGRGVVEAAMTPALVEGVEAGFVLEVDFDFESFFA